MDCLLRKITISPSSSIGYPSHLNEESMLFRWSQFVPWELIAEVDVYQLLRPEKLRPGPVSGLAVSWRLSRDAESSSIIPARVNGTIDLKDVDAPAQSAWTSQSLRVDVLLKPVVRHCISRKCSTLRALCCQYRNTSRPLERLGTPSQQATHHRQGPPQENAHVLEFHHFFLPEVGERRYDLRHRAAEC